MNTKVFIRFFKGFYHVNTSQYKSRPNVSVAQITTFSYPWCFAARESPATKATKKCARPLFLENKAWNKLLGKMFRSINRKMFEREYCRPA